MRFWLTLLAYQATWFVAVIGAGRGLWWPGVAAAALFAAWRLAVSAHRRLELHLMLVALGLGLMLETLWVRGGLLEYRATWPWLAAPGWILALWLAFALTVLPLLGYLRRHLPLAALFGAIGGPLAYWGAARGWGVARFPDPAWHTLLALGAGWALAMPLLAWLARRGLQAESTLHGGVA
ncbi:DUF2878 domain-containing protein [Thermomonas sp.]|uniref:DUF2878 domain-containing protein n=1 Tax=Thermomonas sp. TaxID=1971895 RepID=UPI001AC207F1|nr:DUF2878 domain-containing protein [Xanthomonadales bacterium]MBN8794845.1 DUF2878 domain-containing protein [Stenotrophomonas nitritireducens]